MVEEDISINKSEQALPKKEEIFITNTTLPNTANWKDTSWSDALDTAIAKGYSYIKDSTMSLFYITNRNSVQSIPNIGMKFDNNKLRYSLVPPIATKALAEILTFGAKKYAPNSWATVPNGEERYLDALMRHLEAYRNGEEIDPESNFSHIGHILCNAAFLLHFQKERLIK